MGKRAAVACAATAAVLMSLSAPGAVAVTRAQAGSAWIAYSPSYEEQERGCGEIDGAVFRLTCTDDSGEQRAERQYATYTGGAHKFEGTVVINSLTGSRISLKQTFHSQTGAYFMLAVSNDGRLYVVGDGTTVATGVKVGTAIKVDTIQYVGDRLELYIDDKLVYTTSSDSGSYYDKIGTYRTSSGHGTIQATWSNLKFWHQ
jgi:hypothetical protein